MHYLEIIIEAIDEHFGEGYAKKNPDLVGQMVRGELMITAANVIQDGLYFLGGDDDISSDEPLNQHN
jgi:hypothetical protein